MIPADAAQPAGDPLLLTIPRTCWAPHLPMNNAI
jgi:hypothetical protein